MSGITTGVGLISGIDYYSLVEQMMAVEAQPRDQLLTRISNIDAQKTAFLDISARITALLSHFQFLTRPSSFHATSATSSQPDLLSVDAGLGTPAGSYQFSVRSLATTQQFVSRGLTSRTIPLMPTELTIESGQARVNRATRLNELNGYTGVQRGTFKIINEATGQEAALNIADALTLSEVVDKINAAGISVTARIENDALVLKETSGGTGGLRIENVGDGRTAADLGFGVGHTYAADGELFGTNLMVLSTATPLSALNDGLGLRTGLAGNDFTIQVGSGETGTTISVDLSDLLKPDTQLARLNHGQGVRLGTIKVTSKDGTIRNIDLTGMETISEVEAALKEAWDDDRISVTLNGSRLIIKDSTEVDEGEPEYAFRIEDASGHAAEDLGIVGEADDGEIRGWDVLHMSTLADVLASINHAANNDDGKGAGTPLVTAAISPAGHGLVLQSSAADFTLIAGPQSHALTDLGFTEGTYAGGAVQGTRIIGGVDTTLLKTLNGGNGFALGTLELTANGVTASIDLTGAETLADVVRLINQADPALGVVASYDATGTRLQIVNTDGGTTPIEVGGDFAEATGMTWNGTALRTDNLQRQYISETTRLEDLNNGRGIGYGTIKLTNSLGQFVTIDIRQGDAETLHDVLDLLNNDTPGFDIGLEARINDTGDGIVIIDTTGGSGTLKIEDDTGTAARDLNIAGESDTGQVDGSFEFHLSVGVGDTLDSLADRIEAETTLAEATVLNDGTGVSPYRLNISSRVGGSAGELIIDETVAGEGVGLGFTTLTRAQDARMLFGGSLDSGILLTSSDNTFENVLDGLDVTVSGISESPVTVTVAEDIEGVIETFTKLVEDYNDAISRMKEATAYDEEAEEQGVLLGDSTIRRIESRMYRMFTRFFVGTGGTLNRLSEVGLTMENGSELAFDPEVFRAAQAQDPEAVERFFTDADNGVAGLLKEELEKIIDPDGLIDARTDTLDEKKKLLQDRVERYNKLLDRKQARLLRQFQAMETALAQLQSQQSALTDLASTLGTYATGGSSG